MLDSVKPRPEGYHSLTNYVVVNDVDQAIEFYKRAFGAVETDRPLRLDGKTTIHAEIAIGDTRLMFGREMQGQGGKSAQSLGGSPVGFFYYVADVDGEFKKAVAAGGKVLGEPADMFWGDRCGTIMDPFGQHWTIATHKENLTADEIEERARQFFAKAA